MEYQRIRYSALTRKPVCVQAATTMPPLFHASVAHVFAATLVKGWVAGIEISRIKGILHHAQCLTESLEVYYLTLPQITDRVDNVRIVCQTQNVVIGSSCLLFGCHVLRKLRNDIAPHLKIGCRKRNTCCRCRVNARRAVNKILVKFILLQVGFGQIPCQLVYDRRYHLQMCQLLCADVRQ